MDLISAHVYGMKVRRMLACKRMGHRFLAIQFVRSLPSVAPLARPLCIVHTPSPPSFPLLKALANPPPLYNIGTGKGVSVKQFVEACKKVTGKPIKVGPGAVVPWCPVTPTRVRL